MSLQHRYIPSFILPTLYNPYFICFCLSCLFVFPALLGLCPYTMDLISNVWFVNFYRDFYLQYSTFPQTFNVENDLCLNVFPIFYGDFAYRLFAVVSLFFHLTADQALWISLFLIIYTCTYINLHLYNLKFKNIKIASMLTAISIFTTYALSNLFARGAIMEFIATQFLTISINMLLIFFATHKNKYFLATGFTFFLALSSSVHPITCLLGCIFMIPLIPYTLYKFFQSGIKRTDIIFLFLLFLLYVVINGHFLLATITSKEYFQNMLSVNYITIIDNFITRFSPLPFDIRLYEHSLQSIPTPGLVPQVNILFYLLITVIVFSFRSKKLFLIFFITTCIFLLLIYISVVPIETLRNLISFIQYPYRITTYSNTTLLIGFFFILQNINCSQINQRMIFSFFVIFLICLSIFFLQTIFLYSMYQEHSQIYKFPSSTYVPPHVYGYRSYSSSLYYPPYKSKFPSKELRLEPQEDYYIYKKEVYIEQEITFEINILPFIWNKISVQKDGHPINNFLERAAPTQGIYLTLYEPGYYTIIAQFNPPLLWKILRSAYPFAFFILFGMFFLLGMAVCFGKTLKFFFKGIKPWKTDANKYCA